MDTPLHQRCKNVGRDVIQVRSEGQSVTAKTVPIATQRLLIIHQHELKEKLDTFKFLHKARITTLVPLNNWPESAIVNRVKNSLSMQRPVALRRSFIVNCGPNRIEILCTLLSLLDSMHIDPRVQTYAQNHPYPLLFATISGAHLYGFPSPDSDYDLRGIHVLPLNRVLRLTVDDETVERSTDENGLEMDIVSHDIKKFFGLLLKNNGYVLEQLLSPIIIQTTPEHAELIDLVPQLVTRHHGHHYFGFAESQWRLFMRDNPPRVKPLLYIYRVLLTGIHLMRTGIVQANLVELNKTYQLPYIEEMVALKVNGKEKGYFTDLNLAFHEMEYLRLRKQLEEAMSQSTFPEKPAAAEALNELLVRVRLKYT